MDDGHAQPSSTLHHADDNAALWPAHPVQLARGRQPRDALAKTVPYTVHSLDEFETALREYLASPIDQPEHTEAQLSFWIGASFMVSSTASIPNAPQSQPSSSHQQQQQQQQQHQNPHAPSAFQPANGLASHYGGPVHAYQQHLPDSASNLAIPNYSPTGESSTTNTTNGTKRTQAKVSLSIMEALQPTQDPKEKMRKQRAIAKCCVDSIQQVDGYRYSFHNCWNSREDDSFRFSYYCNDSLLNKDRAANGKGAKLGKRATKPVYDCKGVLSIKFSATKNTLDVFYKHAPIHKTYEERAPPPRKDSKRRKYLEENDPDALTRISTRPKSIKDDEDDPDAQVKPKKKKPAKPEEQRPLNTSLESDLRAQSLRSLLELIQVDPPAPMPSAPEPAPPPPPPPPPPPASRTPQTIVPPPATVQQPPTSTAQLRRRPRSSCNACKIKKTKVRSSLKCINVFDSMENWIWYS